MPKKSIVRERANSRRSPWLVAVGTAGGIAAILTAYSALDSYDLRPAWKGEHLELAQTVYSDKLLALRRELWQVEERIRQLQSLRKPVDKALVDLQESLKQAIAEAEERLRKK